MIGLGPRERIGILTAWATRRNAALKTTGIAIVSDSIASANPQLASLAGATFRPDFGGTPAAYGKVSLVNTRDDTAALYQLRKASVEMVHCGNGLSASLAALSAVTGKRRCQLHIEHPSDPFYITGRVQQNGDVFSVRSVWHLDASRIRVHATRSGATALAHVTGVNSYTIAVVAELPETVPVFRTCGEKICFVQCVGPLPRVRVASCGRWHGALPQTCAVALAIARQVLPFMIDVIPSGAVVHADGVETLPTCVWKGDSIHAAIPETDVQFSTPLRTR